MPLYSIDVRICATAYIKARTKKAALEEARNLTDCSLFVKEDFGCEIEVSENRFDDPSLPDVSLSPAMTCHGVWPGARVERADD